MSGVVEVTGVWTIVDSVRSELLLFVAAMAAYFILFMQRTAHNSPKPQSKKAKQFEVVCKAEDYPEDSCTKSTTIDPKQQAQVEKAFQDAFDSGDYHSALRSWATMKKFQTAPVVSLSQVVESMQRFKKDTPFVLRELNAFLNKFSSECDMSCVNDLLESLAKRLDSELVEKIVEMLPSMNLKMDARTYEVLLNMNFTTRNFQDVKTLVAQMKETSTPFTAKSSMVVIKTALKLSDFDDALQQFGELKESWKVESLSNTASMAPSHIIAQLVELACKEHKLAEFLSNLCGLPISEEVINTMLLECIRQRDSVLTASVEKLAREQDVRFTDATYGLLIKAMAAEPIKVQALVDEVIEKGVEVSAAFVTSVLAFCTQTSNVQMAEKLYASMKPEQVTVLSAFIRFYADVEDYEKACDVYEHDLLRLHGTPDSTTRALHLDSRMERSIMTAALKCGRGHLAKNMLSSSPSDIAKHITMIRNCAAEKNLPGAVSVFESLKQSGVDLNSIIYNTVLDACVECRDLKAAESWMEGMKKDGMTDVVSFNTLIKAHLQMGNFDKARGLITEMKKEGLQPNRVTFNELVNAIVSKGGNGRLKQMWDIIDEMTAADVKPNQVTISILLKNLNSYSGNAEISKTMELINTMDEPMDEVLLSSVVEACVRIGKPDLLETQLKRLKDSSAVTINGSHTYGSLIKAYGHAWDIQGVWRCWKEMRSRHIKPTSITLGCMIEAIVSNGDAEGAFDLIHQMQDDEQCCDAINSVIYCSVLKGFAREKKMDRVWEVYAEMCDRKIELSAIMYNTLLDACARSGRMEHLPKVLEHMKTNNVRPNVITYSTILKGHCQSGNMQAAFSILEEMQKDARLKPDEIMYNSLLDGCAQNGLVDEGLRLLDQMQSEGVAPSNFTLSILVKLMNRARRLDQAFSLVGEITKKYNFWPNVHVYTNLIQACVSNQSLPRAMDILEQMVEERIAPDSRTYSILVRALNSKGLFDQAVGLLRAAIGLPGAPASLQQRAAVCPNLDSAMINEALNMLVDRGHAKDFAIPLLSAIRQGAPKVRIDAATQRKVMSTCIVSEAAPWNKGNGKGKSK